MKTFAITESDDIHIVHGLKQLKEWVNARWPSYYNRKPPGNPEVAIDTMAEDGLLLYKVIDDPGKRKPDPRPSAESFDAKITKATNEIMENVNRRGIANDTATTVIKKAESLVLSALGVSIDGRGNMSLRDSRNSPMKELIDQAIERTCNTVFSELDLDQAVRDALDERGKEKLEALARKHINDRLDKAIEPIAIQMTSAPLKKMLIERLAPISEKEVEELAAGILRTRNRRGW